MYYLLPNTRVHVKSACVGGFSAVMAIAADFCVLRVTPAATMLDVRRTTTTIAAIALSNLGYPSLPFSTPSTPCYNRFVELSTKI